MPFGRLADNRAKERDVIHARLVGRRDTAVAAALDGLDFNDYRNTTGEGLVAVQRFTGRGITAEDLERIEAAGIAFRIAGRE